MALQTLNQAILWPGVTLNVTGIPAMTAGDTLDATGEYTALVCCAPQNMVVSHVGFKAQAVANSPKAWVSIQAVAAATGAPSGDWGSTEVLTLTLTTTFALHALTTPATITKGQMFAVMIRWGDIATSSFNVSTHLVTSTGAAGLPYRVTNVTGSAVKSAMQGMNIVLGSSAAAFYAIPFFLPGASIAQNAFNNTSSAKRGVRFQMPFKARVVGFRHYPGIAVGDYNGILEDDTNNQLSSSSTLFEGDISSALGTASQYCYFDNTVDLSPGDWYRLALEPTSATNLNMYTATLPLSDTNYCQAWPGGANFYYTTFASGSWSNVDTQVPYLDLLLNGLSDDAGIGGGGGKIISG